MSLAPILIFGYGNLGRGDDALGPDLVAAIHREALPGVECIDDIQLQIEHVIDLEGRQKVLFVDADESCAPPYLFENIYAEKDGSYTSHAMTPQALLHAYKQVHGRDAPQAFLLRVRGYRFSLGEKMTEGAHANLAEALDRVKIFCREKS